MTRSGTLEWGLDFVGETTPQSIGRNNAFFLPEAHRQRTYTMDASFDESNLPAPVAKPRIVMDDGTHLLIVVQWRTCAGMRHCGLSLQGLLPCLVGPCEKWPGWMGRGHVIRTVLGYCQAVNGARCQSISSRKRWKAKSLAWQKPIAGPVHDRDYPKLIPLLSPRFSCWNIASSITVL